MLIYNDFDASQTRNYVWTDEQRAADEAADRAMDKAVGRESVYPPNYVDPKAVPYKGMLDDLLPEKPVRLVASVNHYVDGGFELSEQFEISVQFDGPVTLRDALPELEKAQEQSAKEQNGKPRDFFIEGAQLLRDEDGILVLYFGLGT